MTDNELTYEIRGAIFDVYNELGPGLLESVYEEALWSPLRLDIIVNQQVIIELKSVEEMKPVYGKQLLTYLKLMKKHTGLLVNFSENNIREGIQRIVN